MDTSIQLSYSSKILNTLTFIHLICIYLTHKKGQLGLSDHGIQSFIHFMLESMIYYTQVHINQQIRVNESMLYIITSIVCLINGMQLGIGSTGCTIYEREMHLK